MGNDVRQESPYGPGSRKADKTSPAHGEGVDMRQYHDETPMGMHNTDINKGVEPAKILKQISDGTIKKHATKDVSWHPASN